MVAPASELANKGYSFSERTTFAIKSSHGVSAQHIQQETLNNQCRSWHGRHHRLLMITHCHGYKHESCVEIAPLYLTSSILVYAHTQRRKLVSQHKVNLSMKGSSASLWVGIVWNYLLSMRIM